MIKKSYEAKAGNSETLNPNKVNISRQNNPMIGRPRISRTNVPQLH